jgi:hypothetical protein
MLYFLSQEGNGITRGPAFCTIPFPFYEKKYGFSLEGLIFIPSLQIDLEGSPFPYTAP